MKLMRTLALALLLGAPVARAEGEPATVDQVVSKVEKAYADVQTLKASFTQVTRSTAMGAGEPQKGTVMLARPRKMRWVFHTPQETAFVTDGKTMWVWNKKDNQVIVTEEMGQGAGDMSQLLSDLGKLHELFDVTLSNPSGGADGRSWVLELKPKVQSNFTGLRLEIAHDGAVLRTLVVTDAFGSETRLDFDDVQVNSPLEDASFTFQVPAGAQVVKP